MALSDRDIIITPNRGASSEPIITLRGADAASSASMVMRVINSSTVSTLSFEGTSGQLFAVSDTSAGTIFSVNDVSGIPSIEVLDTGDIKLAEWNGRVRVGGINNNENATSTSTGELQVVGGASVWKDMYVGGGMTVVGTLNAAVVTGTISNAANATNAVNVAVTDDPSSGSTMYPTFVSATSGNQAIRTDSNGLVWIPSTNRLGIGTTSPTSRLHVAGPGNTTGGNIHLGDDVNGTAKWTYITGAHYNGATNLTGFSLIGGLSDATKNAVVIGGNIYESNPATEIQFWTHTATTHATGGSQRMVIDTNGNVGIGDTSPTEKLVVAGSAVITGGVYGSETGAPDARIWSVSPANSTWGIFYNEGTPDYIEYRTAGTVSSRIALDTGAAHFGISGGGFVGIGTDTPDIKLDVRGTDTVIQAREDGTTGAWRARILSRNSSANKASFLGTYGSIPGVFAHNYALSAWSPLYVNTTNGSTDGDNVIIAGSGNVGIGNNAPGRKLDVSGVTNVSSHITQGTLISRPNVSWGASGTSTGAVVIKFPGGSGNYGMIHAVIDIYTYDGENASTIIVGGHNWNSAWYSFGATRIGAFSKGVRLGFKDGQYCIVLGTNTSTWSYGQVVVRKIQNGSYYSGVMDLGGTYTIAQDASAESYSYISSNLITTGSAGGGGWNSGNDGSGSGLDADLLDGLDSTAFLRRDVTNTMFAGQTSSLAFENQSTFFRFAFNELRFYDNQNGDIFGLDEHAYATTSMRAPIFYDRNDTAYYLDPAATGKAMLVNGNIELTARSESWAEGIRINVPTAGTWGGIRINRSGASGPGNWAIGYTGLNSTNDLTFYSGTTNTIQVNLDHSANLSSIGSMRAPIFYDSNDTTYYLDPNADLSLRVYGEISNSNYAVGAMQPGALNIGRIDTNYSWGGSWSSDVRAGILANCLNNWEFAIHDSGERVVSPFAFFGGTGGQYLEMGRDIGWGTMPIIATNSFRAPIFYDQNNTAFYTDPASTSVVNNLTVNGTLTYTGTLAAGVDYARRLDNHTRTAFIVGGNASTFYPVVFQLGSGATAQQYGEFMIERGGYDDPGYTGVNFSTMNARFSHKASGWGFGSTYENCEALYQNVQLIANWQQVSESSRMIIWLRGATQYHFYNIVGNTTLVNANAAGGNIVESNPTFYTYTFTPTTTVNAKAQHSKYFNGGAFFDGNNRAFSLGVGTNASGTDGRLDVSSNVRAPIYYDLNDTAYYTDPNSTSVLSTTRVQGATSGWSLMVGENNTTGVYNDNARYGLVINAPYYPHLYLTSTTDGGNTTHGPVISMQGRLTAGGFRKWNIGIPNRNPNELSFGWQDNNDNPHYGVGIGWSQSASMWIDTGHNLFARGSMRAPIFYDYDNTAFYVDPASTSVFNTINATTINATISGSATTANSVSYRGRISAETGRSVYSSGVYTFGTYTSANPGGNPPLTYPEIIAWGNGTGGSIQIAGDWISTTSTPLRVRSLRDCCQDWSSWSSIATSNESFTNNVDLRAPIFYDSNNTAYYTNQAGTSNYFDLQITGASNKYLYINPGNGYEAMVRYNGGSGSGWYVGKRISSQVVGTESFHFYSEAAGQTVGGIDTSGNIFARDSVRAPIFYDNNDTGYYVNPNGTSRIGGIQISPADAGATGNGIRFYGIAGDGNSAYNHTAIIERQWGIVDESELLIFKGNDPDTATIHDRMRIVACGRVVFHSYNAYGTVDDYITAAGTGNINGSGFFNGNNFFVTGEVTAYFSDERLKEKITTVNSVLDKINTLNVFTYRNNELAKSFGYESDKVQLGLSAQEVQKAFPELVDIAAFDFDEELVDGKKVTVSKSGEEYLTLNYNRMTAVLVQAIKEQQSIINKLQHDVEELKSVNKFSISKFIRSMFKKILGK